MSTTFKPLFAAAAQITITADSLATSTTVGRASTVVDNSTNLYDDALLSGIIKTSSSTLGNSKTVAIYAYADANDGTTYTDGVTGSDAGFTRTDPPNLKFLTAVNCPSSSGTYEFGPISVAQAFGGVLPRKWGIVIFNDTNQNLNTGNSFYYQGVQVQGV